MQTAGSRLSCHLPSMVPRGGNSEQAIASNQQPMMSCLFCRYSSRLISPRAYRSSSTSRPGGRRSNPSNDGPNRRETARPKPQRNNCREEQKRDEKMEGPEPAPAVRKAKRVHSTSWLSPSMTRRSKRGVLQNPAGTIRHFHRLLAAPRRAIPEARLPVCAP
jgi:hypothetical protein